MLKSVAKKDHEAVKPRRDAFVCYKGTDANLLLILYVRFEQKWSSSC